MVFIAFNIIHANSFVAYVFKKRVEELSSFRLRALDLLDLLQRKLLGVEVFCDFFDHAIHVDLDLLNQIWVKLLRTKPFNAKLRTMLKFLIEVLLKQRNFTLCIFVDVITIR